jgi:hypothetical protein
MLLHNGVLHLGKVQLQDHRQGQSLHVGWCYWLDSTDSDEVGIQVQDLACSSFHSCCSGTPRLDLKLLHLQRVGLQNGQHSAAGQVAAKMRPAGLRRFNVTHISA